MSNNQRSSPFGMHRTPMSPNIKRDPRTNPSISSFSNIQKTVPNFQKSIQDSEKFFKENLGKTLSPINHNSREEVLLDEISYCKDEVDQLKAEIKKFNNVLRGQYTNVEAKKTTRTHITQHNQEPKNLPRKSMTRFSQPKKPSKFTPKSPKFTPRMERKDEGNPSLDRHPGGIRAKIKTRYPSKEYNKSTYSRNFISKQTHPIHPAGNYSKQIIDNYEEEIAFLRDQNSKLREGLIETEKKLEEQKVLPKPDFGVMKLTKKILYEATQKIINKAEKFHQRNITGIDMFSKKLHSTSKNLSYMKSMSQCESRRKKKEIVALEQKLRGFKQKTDEMMRENLALKKDNGLGAKNLIKSQKNVNKLMRELEIVKQTKHVSGDKEGNFF